MMIMHGVAETKLLKHGIYFSGYYIATDEFMSMSLSTETAEWPSVPPVPTIIQQAHLVSMFKTLIWTET